MSQDPTKTEKQEVDGLSWREIVLTCRRSVELCMEGSRRSFVILVITSLLGSFRPAALAATAGLIVSRVEKMLTNDESDPLILLPWLGIFGGIMLVSGILDAIKTYRESVLSAEMDMVLTKRVLEHRISLDISFLEQPENNDLLSRGTHIAGREFLKFIMQIVGLASLSIQFVTLMGVMMWILPWVTPMLAILTAPMIAFRWRISKLQYQLNYSTTSRMRLRNYYGSELAGTGALPTIKLFGLGSVIGERYRSLNRGLIRLDRKLHRRSAIGQAAGSVGFALLFVVAAGWAAASALTGALSLGYLVTYLASASRFRSCITRITQTTSTAFTNALFVRNIYSFLDVKPTIQVESGIRPASPSRGHIELRDVSFTYPGAASETIHRINLEIMPGESVALVGANGAGKTTLSNLMIRLYDPTEGAVLIDGVDVRDLSADWLYDQIAYVGQSVVRLEVTAADNIAFGDLQRLDGQTEQIAEIAELSGIQSIIDKMPRGLDTVLGRRFGDYSLSGGEWQRLSVARAIAKDAPILMFDEPTANMDARAEYSLFTTLREITKEKTSIIVSHRFATVRSADRIVVLDEGMIAEMGSHDELMRLDQIYAGLYRIQQKALNG
jgi:ATP-binding cassette subfamily B protein